MRLGPPPAAPYSPRKIHDRLLSREMPSDQPVSNSRVPPWPMPSVVPPTEMAYGSLAGSYTPEPSPDEKYIPTPSAAACTRMACSMLVTNGACSSEPLPQELDATEASGCPPVPSTARSALNRPCSPKSPWLQLSPPTTSWFAPGAIA